MYFEKKKQNLNDQKVKKIEVDITKQKENEMKKLKEKMKKKQKEAMMHEQKKKIAEYKIKMKQTEELLANANYIDFEDLQDEEEGDDKLEGYVEGLSQNNGKRPPAVQ